MACIHGVNKTHLPSNPFSIWHHSLNKSPLEEIRPRQCQAIGITITSVNVNSIWSCMPPYINKYHSCGIRDTHNDEVIHKFHTTHYQPFRTQTQEFHTKFVMKLYIIHVNYQQTSVILYSIRSYQYNVNLHVICGFLGLSAVFWGYLIRFTAIFGVCGGFK